MFRFENPEFLYFLLVIPVLIIIRLLTVRGRQRKLRAFGDAKLLARLMPDVSKVRPELKFFILLAALALIIVMVARPQMGSSVNNEKRTGIEAVIALDVSNSMLAEDVEPSRLTRAKMMVENLVDNFTDDKVALVVFAGDAFVQLPITSDYVSAKMFLNDVDPSMIGTQGTDLARAIELSAHSFTQQEGVGRAIVVITDGEDHEGGAIEAAKEARKNGMRVFVLGIGSPKGSPIPDGHGGYMKDAGGNTVMSALNEDMCRQLAEAGGGAYIHVDNNSNAQEQLDAEMAKLSRKEMNSVSYSSYDEQFQAFGIIVVLLLIIEVCIFERKNRIFMRLSLFNRRKTLMLLLLLGAAPALLMAQTDRQLIREGNRLFHSGRYADAEVAYRKAATKNAQNPQAVFNLGNALLAQKKDSAAVDQFQKAARMERNPQRRAMSWHNIGVVCQSHRMFAEAIEAYKEALRLKPTDDQTRYNLELCKRQLKNRPDKNKNNNKNKNQQKKDKKDQNKQDKQNQKQDQQKQQQQKQNNKMSKDNAEQLLNAAMQQEKNTQERLKKAMQQPRARRLQKNW